MILKFLFIQTLGNGEENNSQIFSENTLKKSGSLNNSFPAALNIFQQQLHEFAPGFVIYCNRNNRYTNATSPK